MIFWIIWVGAIGLGPREIESLDLPLIPLSRDSSYWADLRNIRYWGRLEKSFLFV